MHFKIKSKYIANASTSQRYHPLLDRHQPRPERSCPERRELPSPLQITRRSGRGQPLPRGERGPRTHAQGGELILMPRGSLTKRRTPASAPDPRLSRRPPPPALLYSSPGPSFCQGPLAPFPGHFLLRRALYGLSRCFARGLRGPPSPTERSLLNYRRLRRGASPRTAKNLESRLIKRRGRARTLRVWTSVAGRLAARV